MFSPWYDFYNYIYDFSFFFNLFIFTTQNANLRKNIWFLRFLLMKIIENQISAENKNIILVDCGLLDLHNMCSCLYNGMGGYWRGEFVYLVPFSVVYNRFITYNYILYIFSYFMTGLWFFDMELLHNKFKHMLL